MSNNNGIVVCQKTLSMVIILPKEGDLDAVKKGIEEELQIDTGDPFIMMGYTKEAGGAEFGSYGRRWCIEITINASEENDFFDILRHFCKERGIAFNEKGVDPFEGRHSLFGS